MKFFTFKGGIHPLDKKEVTKDLKIQSFTTPKKVYISLLQHIGVPLEPIVKIGEEVKLGQKIAESNAFLSVPVHSSVSGKVIDISIHNFPINGRVKTIVIENNEKDEWVELQPNEKYEKFSKDELLQMIKESGIVGMGGATFPTHVKLSPPADKKLDTLVINGAECEPYLNADNRAMIEKSKEIVEGIKIILKILGINKAYIGIEDNKDEAIEKMREAVEKYMGNCQIEIALLKTKYPQGGEKQLIKAILDREVPAKRLPSEVGVVVQNISTSFAIYEAIVLGKPLIERALTVSGLGVKKPGNYRVRLGVLFEEILKHCEWDAESTNKIIMGGPMMGISQFTTAVPVIKGTSGILALTEQEMNHYKPKSCISCGKCVTACPMNLMPLMFAKLARFEEWEDLDKYNLMDCMECGSCSYVCPSNRPLTEAIKIGKAKLRTIKR